MDSSTAILIGDPSGDVVVDDLFGGFEESSFPVTGFVTASPSEESGEVQLIIFDRDYNDYRLSFSADIYQTGAETVYCKRPTIEIALQWNPQTFSGELRVVVVWSQYTKLVESGDPPIEFEDWELFYKSYAFEVDGDGIVDWDNYDEEGPGRATWDSTSLNNLHPDLAIDPQTGTYCLVYSSTFKDPGNEFEPLWWTIEYTMGIYSGNGTITWNGYSTQISDDASNQVAAPRLDVGTVTLIPPFSSEYMPDAPIWPVIAWNRMEVSGEYGVVRPYIQYTASKEIGESYWDSYPYLSGNTWQLAPTLKCYQQNNNDAEMILFGLAYYDSPDSAPPWDELEIRTRSLSYAWNCEGQELVFSDIDEGVVSNGGGFWSLSNPDSVPTLTLIQPDPDEYTDSLFGLGWIEEDSGDKYVLLSRGDIKS